MPRAKVEVASKTRYLLDPALFWAVESAPGGAGTAFERAGYREFRIGLHFIKLDELAVSQLRVQPAAVALYTECVGCRRQAQSYGVDVFSSGVQRIQQASNDALPFDLLFGIYAYLHVCVSVTSGHQVEASMPGRKVLCYLLGIVAQQAGDAAKVVQRIV